MPAKPADFADFLNLRKHARKRQFQKHFLFPDHKSDPENKKENGKRQTGSHETPGILTQNLTTKAVNMTI